MNEKVLASGMCRISHVSYEGKEEMNFDRIHGNWKQLKGNVKEQWGKLIGDQFIVFEGKRDQVDGKIQANYGMYKNEAEKRLPT